MGKTTTYNLSVRELVFAKLKDYAQLSKMRLSMLVVFTSVAAFLLASDGGASGSMIFLLALSGWMITAASNAFNQILEKNEDKLMNRTMDRPLASERMSITEAALFAGILGTVGIAILGFRFNMMSGLLGALALISYAFIYTPFKKISPAAVFVGAIPGAMPLLIGCTAAEGELSMLAITLFGIQFLWQMPHFWAIAWLMKDDYARAGFHLLPATGQKDRTTALQTLPYLALLVVAGIVPWMMGVTGPVSMVVTAIIGFYYLRTGIQLAIDLSDKSAKKLMFASFFYLPVVLLAMIIDKV